MSSGFYHHSDDINPDEIIQKCAQRLDDIPTPLEDSTIRRKDAVQPSEFFNSNFTTDWTTANHTDEGFELDVPYSELNGKSRRKELKHLLEKRGQFFVVVGEVLTSEDQYKISALVEIRGRAAGGKTEFFVVEYLIGSPGLSDSAS